MTIREHAKERKPINECVLSKGITMLNNIMILNPHFHILGVTGRVKDTDSLVEKAIDKGLIEFTDPLLWYKEIRDEVGLRLLVSDESMVYTIADAIKRENDYSYQDERDYIKNPKDNGYRSLHLYGYILINTPSGNELVMTEIQIRTLPQHGWASVEHGTRYKSGYVSADPTVDEITKAIADLCEIKDYKADKRLVVLAHVLNDSEMKGLLIPLKSILSGENATLAREDILILLDGLKTVRNVNYNKLADLGVQMDEVTSRIFANTDEKALLLSSVEKMNYELSPDKVVPEKESSAAASNAESIEAAKDRVSLKVVEDGIKNLGTKVPESTN